MKIDFNASYRDVSKLLSTASSTKASETKTQPFNKLLASIAPKSAQELDNIIKDREINTLPEPKEPADRGPMARFNFSNPKMLQPEIAPLEPRINIEQPVNQVAEGVKIPSLLSVKRTVAEDRLVELKKDDRVNAVGDMLAEVGYEHGVDPALGMAVVQAESSFNPNAVSSDGHNSKGLFQLLDSTGEELFGIAKIEGRYDPFSPRQNVELGVRYLRRLHDTFANPTALGEKTETFAAANISALEKLAVAAFNAGEGRVASAQQRAEAAGSNPSYYEDIARYLPESTQDYVERVFAFKEQFEHRFVG